LDKNLKTFYKIKLLIIEPALSAEKNKITDSHVISVNPNFTHKNRKLMLNVRKTAAEERETP
jgi:hypothetical protein